MQESKTLSAQPAANAPATGSNLPLGFLLSINQPPSSNVTATVDYQDLQNALHAGNLAAAQQAYLQLQNALMLAYSSASTPGSVGGLLNLAA